MQISSNEMRPRSKVATSRIWTLREWEAYIRRRDASSRWKVPWNQKSSMEVLVPTYKKQFSVNEREIDQTTFFASTHHQFRSRNPIHPQFSSPSLTPIRSTRASQTRESTLLWQYNPPSVTTSQTTEQLLKDWRTLDVTRPRWTILMATIRHIARYWNQE
jgi:hypothetical protein